MNSIVLVAGSGSITGINVIKALISSNINVIGIDCNEINPAQMLCNNFVVPKASSPDYPDRVLNIIDDNLVTHVIACNDHDVRALSNLYQELLSRNIKFNGYSNNTLALLDKEKTYNLFIQNDILTPEVFNDRVEFPCVCRIKKMGKVKKFVYILKNQMELDSIDSAYLENGILSKFIDGEEFTTDYLCDDESNLITAIPRLRIEVRDGMVWHGKVIEDRELINLVGTVAKRLSLRGVGCIQCIKATDGKYYFIEINPRPGSGIDLSINSGVNLPALWVDNVSRKDVNSLIEPIWNMELMRCYSGYYFHGNNSV